MKLEVIMPTAATDDDDDEHHQSLNNAKHDNDDATNINDHNESDTLPQTAKTMNSPSTSTASSQKPIKAARRQSLRSYLQHVSLSDSIIPHSDTTQHSQEKGGRVPPKVSGGNRRRRLEVMGLLQHLKINRYDNSSSATVDIHNSSSVGSDDNSNGDDVGTSNTTSRSGHQHGQRCLLHPTVRMRNDKCSLCCALAKTLEVRKAKKVVEENAITAMMEIEEGVIGRDKDGPQGELDNHHLELIEEEQLQIIDAEQLEETFNKEDALSDDKLSTKRSDDSSSSTPVAPTTARRESEAPTATINNNDDVDDDQVPQSTIDELDPRSTTTLNKLSQRLLPNEKCRAATTSSSSMITAMTVPATSAMISKDDDNDNGGGDSDCVSKDTSFPRPTTVALTKLQKTIALAKGALDSKPRQQKQENRQHSRIFSRNLSAEAELKIVPLKDVSSSPDKRSRSDVVVRRSSSYGSHASGESQSLPFQEVAVPSTVTSSDASVRSTSDSSTLTSSTMGNNSLGSNSLGIHLGTTPHLPSQTIDEGDDNNVSKLKQVSKTVTAKRETTTVPSVAEGDVGDSSPSLDGEDSSGSACDAQPGEEDGDVAVSTPSHVVASGNSSSSVAGTDAKNKAAIQSANVIVEDVYSDSDEEDKDGHVPSTKAVQLQSQTKAFDATKSNEEEENDEERIDSENGITSVTTPKRKHLEKEESSAKQSPSPTSVVEGPSTTSLPLETMTNISHKVEGGTVDPTLASDEDSNTRRDSLRANSNSSAANSSNKHQNQFSEVERRLSRANQRLSRSTTRRENNNKQRSRSRSIESKIPFFAALVEHARSRSNSRTRQRSRSRSVTREGAEN
eukprot:scaffold29617_cov80-Skeletonema_dohrnii-CCMP3373.AAC.1